MNLTTRSLGLLTLSAGVLFVSGTNPRGTAHAQTAERSSATSSGETAQSKIARAMSAGPVDVAKSARIVDTDARGTVVLREGNNGFTCMPGNPRVIGDPPMCADGAAMQWSADFKAHKAKPTNTEPGIIYMLADAPKRNHSDVLGPVDYPRRSSGRRWTLCVVSHASRRTTIRWRVWSKHSIRDHLWDEYNPGPENRYRNMVARCLRPCNARGRRPRWVPSFPSVSLLPLHQIVRR